MKRCAFEHTFVCVVLRTKKVCCSNTPNLRVRWPLADMTLDLPATFFFQIAGIAPGIVTRAAPFM